MRNHPKSSSETLYLEPFPPLPLSPHFQCYYIHIHTHFLSPSFSFTYACKEKKKKKKKEELEWWKSEGGGPGEVREYEFHLRENPTPPFYRYFVNRTPISLPPLPYMGVSGFAPMQ